MRRAPYLADPIRLHRIHVGEISVFQMLALVGPRSWESGPRFGNPVHIAPHEARHLGIMADLLDLPDRTHKVSQDTTPIGREGVLTRNVNPWCINCGNVSVRIAVHVPQEQARPRTTAPSYISNSARDISISSRMVADPPGLPKRVTSTAQYFSSSMPLIETCREG